MDSPDLLANLPEKFVGERIVVRPFQAGDGQALFEAIDESREHLLPWLPWGAFHANVETTEAKVLEMRRNWDERIDLPVSIWNADESRLLGGTGMHRFDLRLRSFELGYWVRKSEAGKGYVSEAVRLLTDYLFREVAANRVFIRCATENHQSSAVAKRLGFVLEGVARNTSLDSDGNLQHLEVYSLIPEEYALVRLTWPA